MKFWWVNHKQTVSHEIGDGFLWSPKRKKNGKPSHFYENMRKARPGDYVVSFANTKIGHYGIVSGLPLDAPRPEKFKKPSQSWLDDGWLVPVSWDRLDTPFRPKDHIDQIKDYLPPKYSPIRNNGDGNQGAYLCEITQLLFEKLEALGNFNPKVHAVETGTTDDEEIINNIEDQIQKDIKKKLVETEAQAVIKARKGQGIFRRNVERIELSCRISGLEDKRLLIASHIKPWRRCKTSDERLDGCNGLLLAPHIDRLFDKGLISFMRDGKVLVSDSVDGKTIECLGLKDVLERGVEAFSEAQDEYLDYHRCNVFLP